MTAQLLETTKEAKFNYYQNSDSKDGKMHYKLIYQLSEHGKYKKKLGWQIRLIFLPEEKEAAVKKLVKLSVEEQNKCLKLAKNSNVFSDLLHSASSSDVDKAYLNELNAPIFKSKKEAYQTYCDFCKQLNVVPPLEEVEIHNIYQYKKIPSICIEKNNEENIWEFRFEAVYTNKLNDQKKILDAAINDLGNLKFDKRIEALTYLETWIKYKGYKV